MTNTTDKAKTSSTKTQNPGMPFDSRPDAAMIRERHLIPIISISSATLWRYVKAGKFPQPNKLSERVTAWRVGDVRAWLESKSAASLPQ